LETFTQIKQFVDNPRYDEQRREIVDELDSDTIDAPIADLISGLAMLPYCFTLQSCYGHFLHGDQRNPRNTEPLPVSGHIAVVEYRLAYIALCIQNDDSGKALFDDLANVVAIDPAYVQWGCAEWFWSTYPNSYVLQVEPAGHMKKDKVSVDYREALHLEMTRDRFFSVLKGVVRDRIDRS